MHKAILSAVAVLTLPLVAACVPRGEARTPQVDPVSVLGADSATILEDLRFLSSDALQGRAPATDGSAQARERLVRRFEEASLEALPGGGMEHAFRFTRRGDTTEIVGTNVIAIHRGSELPDRVIVVSGHYDHVGVRGGEVFNGADDNASGAVGITALARALSGLPLRHTVVFAAWDAEESGLRGARAFVANPPLPLDAVVLNLNLDMVARTGGTLWAAGAHHTPSLRPVLEDVATRAPLSLKLGHDRPDAPEGDDWTRQSDHAAFHAVGIPFVYLGVEDHPDYHRPTDDFERVDPGEYMNALRTALMVLLAFDEALPLPPP